MPSTTNAHPMSIVGVSGFATERPSAFAGGSGAGARVDALQRDARLVLQAMAMRGVGLGQTVLSAIGPGWRISERQRALIAGWRSRFGGVKESGGTAFMLPPAFPQWRPRTAAFSALGKLAEYSDAANELVTKAHPNDKERRALLKAIAASRVPGVNAWRKQ